MSDRDGMVEAVAKALSQELERAREYPGFEYLTDDESADIAVRALSPWLLSPEEAKAVLLQWPEDTNAVTGRGMAKLRRLAGENE